MRNFKYVSHERIGMDIQDKDFCEYCLFLGLKEEVEFVVPANLCAGCFFEYWYAREWGQVAICKEWADFFREKKYYTTVKELERMIKLDKMVTITRFAGIGAAVGVGYFLLDNPFASLSFAALWLALFLWGRRTDDQI